MDNKKIKQDLNKKNALKILEKWQRELDKRNSDIELTNIKDNQLSSSKKLE